MDCTTHTAASSVPDVAYSRSLTPRIITWLIQRVGTSENVTESGVLAEVKEEIYQSCVLLLDNSQTNDELRRLEKRMGELESANTALRDDSDAQEQYSRSNCLLVHGIPEDQTDTSDAVLSLCNAQLGLDLDRGHIDRSHRLGHRSETQTTAGSPPKPRPVIVKLTTYETRKAIFSNKRKLKGTRYVVTENLTHASIIDI